MTKATKLPKSIEKCPIIDALIEIRFDTDINPNAVFGLFYGALMKDYSGRVENLPILQVPEAVRASDPSLRYKPLYRIISEDVFIQIGPEVLSISSRIPYKGWDCFQSHVVKIIDLIKTAGVIKKVSRIGHRYINFFELNILDKITMKFKMTEGYDFQNIQISTQVSDNGFNNTVMFSNSAIMNVNTPDKKEGSIIDIDTFKEYENNHFLENVSVEIENAHKTEKTLFFSLLNEDFIDSLNPQY